MAIKVTYTANNNERTANIRELVCRIQSGQVSANENPLPRFNLMLDWVLEQAFAEGVDFGRMHPELDVVLNLEAGPLK